MKCNYSYHNIQIYANFYLNPAEIINDVQVEQVLQLSFDYH
ncbi:hypothetical protein PanWU01x14_191450 [Parasponia andersonii]|uniref:Uncharacterized protein n=1 Tax=Parasponia andersonii TaxID=3476 RepID=A0A2P5C1L0_PARAD|nr:hypothetical protein PanWU01x14_191450 [Parasponia andersonii]